MADAEVPELAPRAFRRALASVRAALVRPEVQVSALTAPSRMAPWASALAGRVPSGAAPGRRGPHDAAQGSPAGTGVGTGVGAGAEPEVDDLASGRLVLLHDPAGQSAWQGTFRVVVYLRAELEADVAQDPLVGDVAWSWLLDALAAAEASPLALGGTVTLVTSRSFGDLAADPDDGPGEGGAAGPGGVAAEVELRASWTPPAGSVGASVTAWADVMACAAGLAHLPQGVAQLPRRLS